MHLLPFPSRLPASTQSATRDQLATQLRGGVAPARARRSNGSHRGLWGSTAVLRPSSLATAHLPPGTRSRVRSSVTSCCAAGVPPLPRNTRAAVKARRCLCWRGCSSPLCTSTSLRPRLAGLLACRAHASVVAGCGGVRGFESFILVGKGAGKEGSVPSSRETVPSSMDLI